jgi:hypothetical protein
MNWRVVYNDQTQRYRLEIRRWWGWDFVADRGRGDYLSFDSYAAARNWGCRHLRPPRQPGRRWRVLSICDCPDAGG